MVIAKIVGRVPVDKEDWVEGKAYKRRNQVHRFNCIFESRIDNNTTCPATFDEETEEITFNTTEWKIMMDGSEYWLFKRKFQGYADPEMGETIIDELD